MRNLFKKIKQLFTLHKCVFEKDGMHFYAGYMADGDVYLQKYKCSCGADKLERV